MKISICFTIKNRSNIVYTEKDLTLQERQVLTSIENTYNIVKAENLNNTLFKTVRQHLSTPFKMTENCLISLLSLLKKSEYLKQHEFELVICDWNSTDVNLDELLNTLTNKIYQIPYKVVKIDREGFSRGYGLNITFEHSTGDIIFFTDADMLFSSELMFEECIEAVINGKTAWPVCYKASDPTCFALTTEWAGYGNCWFSRNDFINSGKWEDIKRWGKEDLNLFNTVRHKPNFIRKPYFGFIHQWHGDNLRTKEQL